MVATVPHSGSYDGRMSFDKGRDLGVGIGSERET